MTSKTVLTSPNADLRVISSDFPKEEFGTKETAALTRDLIETMRVENGIGIAAPQIGVHKRMIIVDVGNNKPQAFFNPKITSKSFTKIESEEGCLSVPGVFGIVKRHRSVTVTAQNIKGLNETFRAEGLMAIVFQHEIDHLDGILFIDKVLRYTTHPKL
ncbi:peptide deformylase [Candidatus Uhrbacteria bacterium RIFCSPHIGHO2_02_FULL_47_44]|uniref:Peptide deformylase n=1 Tax=Candidatus Uhrbacteria bacterium RIFCSPLOWO2_02_FULL_48_18 TaxID=1802408 RepID=A0A1F7VCY5_9BACT|nr:MAG: peptide deformylase [Candidatus Uhrbacteria bacterium RIFCSPHIGHO2_02_FULL_47_44]OGL76873.1 MAG: peptide deformylase [Candidatus Uhrbacteria bacterium RIFCSPHIGHO2_12_FULL_47_12]OGL82342.1 MAG: peptide deformylase [Candidatus Uhrbacteria bacterium RIFCSPLOWO2_01_FULL_47_17]OGL87988.1 MAG: peptide deformylase [Candidatus Uhrbacteria bacterium RIFCSPLOWO2_02_FULL_48_18]OGL92524.1 MAG: peptide deformylase [Candidatus Uhrbacteria bacterium RIFCSPLOWO2_12_FULL_47_9]